MAGRRRESTSRAVRLVQVEGGGVPTGRDRDKGQTGPTPNTWKLRDVLGDDLGVGLFVDEVSAGRYVEDTLRARVTGVAWLNGRVGFWQDGRAVVEAARAR